MLAGVVLAAALTPLQLFFRAEDAWEARALPAYVSFDTVITHNETGGAITRGNEHVVLRTFDHWCATVEIDQGLSEPKTSRGPNCLGPAYSPLGFNISSVYPGSGQPDPFAASSLPVIASVRAAHYDVTLAGEETIEDVPVYHLLLRPLNAPEHYPLRALWIDRTTYQVRKLTYAENPGGWSAAIDYSFKPYTVRNIWWISEIDASWQPAPNSRDRAFTSTLVLQNVSFPSL